MVQSWIKMRVDLRNHPKVKRMARVLKADRLRVVGGLHAVWSHFDTYSPNGTLDYDTFETIDEEVGWKGFARAMADIGWLIESEVGLVAPDYEQHNGPTGKRRALDTKRKAGERNWDKGPPQRGQPSAFDADTSGGDESGQMSASDADTPSGSAWNRGEERREEKRREEKTPPDSSGRGDSPVRAPATVCRALKDAGIPGVSPAHPRLLALLDAGATEAEFVDAAPKGVGKSDGFAYVLGVVEGRRRDAALARNGLHHGPMPTAETPMQREARQRVEAAVPNLAPRREPQPMEVVDVVAKRMG